MGLSLFLFNDLERPGFTPWAGNAVGFDGIAAQPLNPAKAGAASFMSVSPERPKRGQPPFSIHLLDGAKIQP
jgi:hypothetical protein